MTGFAALAEAIERERSLYPRHDDRLTHWTTFREMVAREDAYLELWERVQALEGAIATHGAEACGILLARAEAAEAERDRQYDENVHRIRMEASAYTRGRGDGLREAAKVARSEGVYHELNVYGGGPDWYKHGQRIAAAILALIEKPEGER